MMEPCVFPGACCHRCAVCLDVGVVEFKTFHSQDHSDEVAESQCVRWRLTGRGY